MSISNSNSIYHIGFFVKAFPVPSQKFIQVQIEEILKSGFKVTVIAENKSDLNLVKNKNLKIVELNTATCSYVGRVINFLGLYMSDRKFRKVTKVASSFKGRGFLKLWFVNEYLGTINLEKVDLLHVMFSTYLPRIYYLEKLGIVKNTRKVVSCRGYDITTVNPHGEFEIEDSKYEVSKYLPVSESLKGVLESKKIEPDRISVIYSGIETDNINYLRTFSFPSHGGLIKLLSIGRLTEKKGHDTSIRIVSGLVKSGLNVQLTIIGEGVEFHNLSSLAVELGISDKVFFAGQKSWNQAMETLYSSHFFLLMSKTASNGDQEGIPNVLKEAMAAGIPCISTYHSGIPELKTLDKFGLLCNEDDVAHGLNVLLKQLALSKDSIENIRAENRKFIEEYFDSKRINQKLVSVYKEVLNES